MVRKILFKINLQFILKNLKYLRNRQIVLEKLKHNFFKKKFLTWNQKCSITFYIKQCTMVVVIIIVILVGCNRFLLRRMYELRCRRVVTFVLFSMRHHTMKTIYMNEHGGITFEISDRFWVRRGLNHLFISLLHLRSFPFNNGRTLFLLLTSCFHFPSLRVRIPCLTSIPHFIM